MSTPRDTRNPARFKVLLDVVVANVTVDARLGRGELVELFRSLAGSEIVQLRLPVTDAVRNGAAVLVPATGADEVLARFRSLSGATTPSGPLDDPPAPTVAQGRAWRQDRRPPPWRPRRRPASAELDRSDLEPPRPLLSRPPRSTDSVSGPRTYRGRTRRG